LAKETLPIPGALAKVCTRQSSVQEQRVWRTYYNLGGIFVLGRSRYSKLVEGIQHGWGCILKVHPLASPHLAQWEGIKLEVRNNSKIVTSSPQSPV
jgi:hypothetical protein